MKTIEIKVYSFDELSKASKENAIDNIRNKGIDSQWNCDEAHESFKKFAEIFNISKHYQIDYCEPYRNEYYFSQDDNIKELSGLRLQKYLWNNYKTDLFKGKYYSLWSKIEVSYKYHKQGYPVLKSRYSKITLDNSCVLTGVCYDMDLLDPIYKFLEHATNDTFSELIDECINSLCKSVNSEIEYQNSDEGIIEHINCNEYQFTENGEVY